MSLVRLAAADVGRRVVVRHLLPDGSATDVLGELVRLDAAGVAVRTDRGRVVEVARADLVAAKPVPARPVRPTSSAEDVQRVADLGWPGLERQRLGGWVLRAGGGFTGRANSALAVGDPGVPEPAAVAAVESFYGARGLPPKVQVPFGLTGPHDPARGLDTALARRGWTADAPTLLMTADLRQAVGVPSPSSQRPVRLRDEPDEAWLERYRYRGGPVPPAARDVLLAAPWQRFASVVTGGEVVAVGRVAVAEGWAGVTAMTVADDHRGRGPGGAVLDAPLAAGAAAGTRWAYLQVVAGNDAATSLYRGRGFVPHHRYHYRTAG